jgi:predicted AlkP superfamily pyrophosphatase or phosphodiesterase
MKRVAVLNVVGLTGGLIGDATPKIARFRSSGAQCPIVPAFPAVTCTAQSNYLTGRPPSEHGIVANGWYNRDLAEVQFWKQSNHLVRGEKIWDKARAKIPGFTCAKLFWWYNMYSTADYSITPRPMYPADGRKVFDIYTSPAPLREAIKADLGDFPFATFWGPAAGMAGPQGGPDAASRWIAESAKWIERKYQPTLSLVYLPHLDYNMQRVGPAASGIAEDLRRIDDIVGELIAFFQERGVQPILLSEYGITEVSQPVHLNRIFREQGWIAIREELGLELLDAGASRVFAVADHQVAHVYVNDPSLTEAVGGLLKTIPGVESVLGAREKVERGIEHERAGDWVVTARPEAWFTYYYWLNDDRAPDFARCVDIHRKPGYDPVELFLDPELHWPKVKIATRLLKKKLGFRMLMDVVPLRAELVRGSHGIRPARLEDWPVWIGPSSRVPAEPVASTAICEMMLRELLS